VASYFLLATLYMDRTVWNATHGFFEGHISYKYPVLSQICSTVYGMQFIANGITPEDLEW